MSADTQFESTERPDTSGRGLPPGERVMRLAAEPRHTIVVAAAGPRARLEALLRVLVPACMARGTELVVARACSPAEYKELAGTFPAVLFMPAADGSTPRQLRALGLTAADGDVVTFAEDDRALTAEWVAEVTSRTSSTGG